MSGALFVTGTDTGVGKTLVSAALVHGFAGMGLRSAGMKPVAAGCRRSQGKLLSDDIEMLRAASSVHLAPALENPYAFEPPLAPHIAARRAGVRIDPEVIVEAARQARGMVDMLVVEGVGGFRVPLDDACDTADLAVRLGMPLILVVGMRLGCLSHALLTAEAIAARNLVLAGWVANTVDPAMAAYTENLEALQLGLSAPCLGVVPYMGSSPRVDLVAQVIDHAMLLQNDWHHRENG
jgi:dethiobiotin synthetase